MPLSIPMPVVWGVLLVIFLIVEGATAGLASIWFAVGALAALICSLLHAPLWLQIVCFIVVSIAALILTRPLARKYVNSKTKATNADRVIGQTGVVIEAIDNLAARGTVHIGGKTWSARSMYDESIPAQTRVCAEAIEGVKLLVRPVAAREEASAAQE